MISEGHDEYLLRLCRLETVDRLVGLGLRWSRMDAAACAAVHFQRRVRNAPPIVGLIGGASAGKSTIFNSMIGREISRTSALAHQTLGPVAAVRWQASAEFERPAADGAIFSPMRLVRVDDSLPTSGEPGVVQHCVLADGMASALPPVILVDLPDVTSKMADDEGQVATNLLPWLDGIVVVVDEERYHDETVLGHALDAARQFGPSIWILFNQTERSQPPGDAEIDRLSNVAADHRAEGFAVSGHVGGSGYRPVDAAVAGKIAEWVRGIADRSRRRPLESCVQRRCAELLRENVTRSEQFSRLCDAAQQELAKLVGDTHLSLDLLTDQERQLLGIGHRFVPLYDAVRGLGRQLGWLTGRSRSWDAAGFDKRDAQLSEVLARNFEQRFRHAADCIDQIVTDSAYATGLTGDWQPTWTVPPFDAKQWASRISAQLENWKTESARQAKRSDAVSMTVGLPLVLADLLFLGGAGLSLSWAGVWLAGFLGGKGLSRMVQKSAAFSDYQTSVRAYQAYLREALAVQWETNRAALPRRHLPMDDPIMEAALEGSGPGGGA